MSTSEAAELSLVCVRKPFASLIFLLNFLLNLAHFNNGNIIMKLLLKLTFCKPRSHNQLDFY